MWSSKSHKASNHSNNSSSLARSLKTFSSIASYTKSLWAADWLRRTKKTTEPGRCFHFTPTSFLMVRVHNARTLSCCRASPLESQFKKSLNRWGSKKCFIVSYRLKDVKHDDRHKEWCLIHKQIHYRESLQNMFPSADEKKPNYILA